MIVVDQLKIGDSRSKKLKVDKNIKDATSPYKRP